MKNLLCKTLLAAAGATLITQAAHAQTVTYTPEDLLLGVDTVSGSPAAITGTKDLLVDLGQASIYYQATSPFFVGTQAGTGSGFTLNDVNTVLGSANSQSWAVIGTVKAGDPSNPAGLAASTLFVSQPRANASTQSTPWNRSSTFAQNPSASKISTTGASGYNGSTSLSDSASAISQTPAASTPNYGGEMGANGNLSGSFAVGSSSLQQVTSGTFSSGGHSLLDLYEVVPSSTAGQSATFLGYFDWATDGAGNMSLQFVPVPEPSTYGLVAGAGLLALCLRNQLRRKQA